MKKLLLALAFVALSSPTFAQGLKGIAQKNDVNRPGGGATAIDKVLTPDELWDKIQTAKIEDLTYAKALADKANTPGSKIRSTCFAAWLKVAKNQQGVDLKDDAGNPITQPDPALFTKLEKIAELADGLQPTSDFMVACAPAANAVRMSIAQFVTLAISGAASLSRFGVAF